jgi:hypothetical protein
MKSHRCKELLEYNKHNWRKIFIRYKKEYDTINMPNNDKISWWLCNVVYSWEDWNTTYTENVCEITHCPFCGEHLE